MILKNPEHGNQFTLFRMCLVGGLALGLLVGSSACAANKAAKQPGLKNFAVLDPGKPRRQVVAELGEPVTSEVQDGKKVEIYDFVQGYHGGTRFLRSFFHLGASVITLGLWEIVGNPIENGFNGEPMTVEVTYDGQDRVESSVVVKGDSDEIKRRDFEESASLHNDVE